MGFVDEQDDRFFGTAYRVDHAFEALFEFTFDAGTGLQQAQVEDAQGDFLQRRRHIPGGDTQGQALHHRRLADAWRAHQDRVVLPAPEQDVDALADFAVAADDGIDAPGPGVGGQVLGVLVQDRVLFLGRLAGFGRAHATDMLAGAFGPFQ